MYFFYYFQAPPLGILPPESTLLEMACESSFFDAELDGLCYQVNINLSLYNLFPSYYNFFHLMTFFVLPRLWR